ncbi:docking protein 3-like isoform X2 [Gigantopelta aegis]|uniref:docking protein 3-like isoform X2 n=1 Tax=Gigantopelta aegis TaxID=1735272 RepID=UPI001B88D4E8|nr:docking protein 3-like isoform X2 [Gigantopelta aegis]
MSQDEDYYDTIQETGGTNYVNVEICKSEAGRFDCNASDTDNYLQPTFDPHGHLVDTTSSEPVPGTMGYSHSEMQKQPQRNMKTLSKDSAYSTSSGETERCFDVYVEPFVCKKTPPTFGSSVLAVNGVSLELRSKDNGTTYLTWPIVFIRRYGATEQIFQLEAGRRSESGEGLFNFFTPYGKLIIEEIKRRSAHSEKT